MAGLYIHIPFCENKCFYCDFFSGNQLYLIDNYVDAIIKELCIRKTYLNNYKIETIYFGGGTPSLLSKYQLSKIFQAIHTNFNVDKNSEITIECNPENINENYVNDLYELGINRISLGVQFLNNEVLSFFNRRHTNELICSALYVINNSSITNLSIDLLYSVPGISNQNLLSSLKDLMNFDIRHVSAYSLTIAKNSKLFWKISKSEVEENSESEFLSQYTLINEFLKSKKFVQYEVSNYALIGYMSYHNLAYWNQISYLGVGVSAHSYNLVSRQWNHTNIKKYIRELNTGDGVISYEMEQLTENQRYNEYIILRLRTFQGLSLDFIKSNFNVDIYNFFQTNINKLIDKNFFLVNNNQIVPKESDLLLSDYLSKYLMI
jgi:oxygen-independent coproporphyrinogen-3 oxidase